MGLIIRFCSFGLFYQFEIAGGMFAQGADEIGGKFVALVDVAADFADPFFRARSRGLGGGLGLYVLLVVGVGDAGTGGKDFGLHHTGDEHGVRA